MAGEVVYFISDTHLGDGSSADRFRYPEQLLEVLARIEAEPRAHLVLLGDFMELWAATMESVLVSHAPVLGALARIAARHSISYVVGNHDCLPWYYYVGSSVGNIRVCEQFTAGRNQLIALHGHQFDPFNQVKTDEGHVKAPWTRRLVQAIGVLGRYGGSAAGDALSDAGTLLEKAASSVEQLLPGADGPAHGRLKAFLMQMGHVASHQSPGERGYPSAERIYEQAAHNLMRGGAQFVVMGHTHHPLVRKYGNRLYVNTGAWVWDRYPPTYGRFADGRLELLNAATHTPFVPGD